jgi:hypothetical protein
MQQMCYFMLSYTMKTGSLQGYRLKAARHLHQSLFLNQWPVTFIEPPVPDLLDTYTPNPLC